jgi:AcrR family transcriptional regulator
MGRPKRQAKRRSQIIQAACRAMATRSYAGTRIKDIAAEAGLSPQAVLYYYPDIDALLVESIALQIERFVELRRELADTLDDPRDKLVATMRAGFPTGPDDGVAIIYNCVGAIRSDPALRAMTRALTGQQVELYRRILETGASAGVFHLAGDSRTIATNIVALEDAYGLYIVEGGPVGEDESLAYVMAYASLATGVELSAFLKGPSTG